MLRSPVLTAYPRSPLHKALPGRPRSHTTPSTPMVAELPGSILLENQGFPNPRIRAPSELPSGADNERQHGMLGPTLQRPPITRRDRCSTVPQHRRSRSERNLAPTTVLSTSPHPSPAHTHRSDTSRFVGGEGSSFDTVTLPSESNSGSSILLSPMMLRSSPATSRTVSADSVPKSEVSHFTRCCCDFCRCVLRLVPLKWRQSFILLTSR